jgi:hypothetical protein
VHKAVSLLLFLAAAAAGVPALRAEEAIQDNSFLIEEAYNQGRGVVQHIATYVRSDHAGNWASSFTQEWPVPDVRHQLSYTLTALRVQDEAGNDQGLGDIAFNYRYQLLGDGGEKIAMAPRASVLLPTGDDSSRLGAGAYGMQINLPTSVVLHPKVVTHFNVGATWLQGAKNPAGDRADLTAYSVGQSVVGLITPRLNVLVELVFNSGQVISEDGTRDRIDAVFVNPGFRWSHNLTNGLQIVPGISVPIGLGPSGGSHAVFFYLSFEHPF